jgi:glycosyltransferase involved in cell wall biosynthesis
LDCLEYPNFEVVVVDGPSIDWTLELLGKYAHRIKIGKNPTRNLSISRNIGITLSSGEIVAFMDDDGVPPPEWLSALAASYEDPAVGAAGGEVVYEDGKTLQFSHGLLSIWGQVDAIRPEASEFTQADGTLFNTLMGVNSSFRRSVLEEIGGFDETYNYYHDEADVCFRVNEAGYKVDHGVDATVKHEHPVGDLRGGLLNANLEAISQNTVYFALKATEGRFNTLKRLKGALRSGLVHVSWARQLSLGVFARVNLRVWRGILRGIRLGFFGPRKTLPPEQLRVKLPFKNFSLLVPTVPRKRGLSIALATQDYLPAGIGGIVRRTATLATELARRGHEPIIITRGKLPRTRYYQGIPVRETPDPYLPELQYLSERMASTRNLSHAFGVRRVAKELALAGRADLLYAPLWDVEGYAAGLDGSVPLVVDVVSQLKTVMKTNGWPETPDMTLMCELEKRLLEMEGTRGITSASRVALETVKQLYNVSLDGKPTQTVYCGVDIPEELPQQNPTRTVRVLFVGRLEKRKGIHTLFEAAATIIRKNRNVEFIIVGDDTLPNEEGIPYKVAYRKLLRKTGARKRMTFLGRVSDDRLQQEYSLCDIFVAPSLYESFGIIYTEAMAWGKPVIGCRTGGVPEVIEHEVCGLLIEPGNADELAEAVLRLADSPDARRELGQRAREITATKFSPAAQADAALEIFDRVLSSRKR